MRSLWCLCILAFAAPSARASELYGFSGYQGFLSQGGNSNGSCVWANGSDLELVSCENLLLTSNISLLSDGTMLANNLCVDIDPIFEMVILTTCSASQTQEWAFAGGLVKNRGTGQCWVASGGGISAGSCAPVGNSANLWMPVLLPMAIYSSGTNLTINDKDQNYNSDHADLDLLPFNDEYFWQATIWWQPNFGFRTLLVNHYDYYVADVYADKIGPNGAGVVDMATANGTEAQHWYFATQSNTPQGTPLIMSGTSGGGTYCLDVKNDNKVQGTNLDVYLCDSQYGNGNNPAQLWQAVIDGFPTS